MFGQNREQLRQFYHDVWLKMQSSEAMSALEQSIAQVIKMHPEYHAVFEKKGHLEQEYFVEAGDTNPYLHMGLHLSLHEQISTDRPAGIRDVYQKLLTKTGDSHQTEHDMMECLAESLWQAQRDNQPPSETRYLDALNTLLT
ncbi:DUF1841 family protein [Methylophaga sp.]|uniref:DUF1841 family protein n=1 Tax=Methylophaga sp. TaxID=2024840 RepID=UPI003F69B4D2